MFMMGNKEIVYPKDNAANKKNVAKVDQSRLKPEFLIAVSLSVKWGITHSHHVSGKDFITLA